MAGPRSRRGGPTVGGAGAQSTGSAGGRSPTSHYGSHRRKNGGILKRIFAIAAMVLAALLVMASGAVAATTINPANAPSGTHLQAGAIGCTVGSGGSVTCSAFELGGVGHTNATVDLVANYSATIDC